MRSASKKRLSGTSFSTNRKLDPTHMGFLISRFSIQQNRDKIQTFNSQWHAVEWICAQSDRQAAGLRQVLLVQKSRDVIRDNEQDVLSCSGKVKFKGEQVSLDIPIGASDFPT